MTTIMEELQKYAPHITIGASVAIPAALTALHFLMPRPAPALASLSFEERKVESSPRYALAEEVVPLWREANTIWTSRLLWGRNILVGNYIEILPDVDGDYKVVWGFENWIGSLRGGGDYDMYTQKITGLKAGVSSGKVFLPDQKSYAVYDYWTNFDNEGLYWVGAKPGVVYVCEHRTRATVTSPSGQVVTTPITKWSDNMQYKMPPLTATLSFDERKLT